MAIRDLHIKVCKLKPSMVVSHSVTTESGEIIVPKDTILHQSDILALEQKQINAIRIYACCKPPLPGLNWQDKDVPATAKSFKVLEDKREFASFEQNYELQTDIAKELLLSIARGTIIDTGVLYTVTAEIINTLRSKGNLFPFLWHLKCREEHTFNHCMNTSLLCNIVGIWLGLPTASLVELTTAGLLADIGKLSINHILLSKTSPLTSAELNELKKHPQYSYEMVKDSPLPETVKSIILMHHERHDGSGYPQGLTGSDIIPFAKIVAICDKYDAMTSYRSYRDKICPFQVIKILEDDYCADIDSDYARLFLKNIACNFIGAYTQISDGRIGEVVFINTNNISSPVVRIGNEMTDLSQDENKALYINKLL